MGTISSFQAEFRKETDSLGEVEVPSTKLWGAQTQRSLLHFSIGQALIPRDMIHSYVILKKAAAITNHAEERLGNEQFNLIVEACNEILAGEHHDMFPLHVWMTGSGTQFNMNVNEVISNICCMLAGTPLGSKTPVHPNDHVNMSQSSNDTFPSAMYITAAVNTKQYLVPSITALRDAIEAKAEEWKDVVKIGRTHLQDATPLTVGQEWSGWAGLLSDNLERIDQALEGVYRLALGGTAVGTELNTLPGFPEAAAAEIARLTGLRFVTAPNKFTVQGSHDENHSLLTLFLLSSIAIPVFYAAGLMYGQHSSLTTAEYWRWWVVHLWVEGFFEVFATAVIAFLFTRLKLLSISTGTRAVLFSTVIYLSGGIIGTFHHLYFSGTPSAVLGFGAVFSALEVVPLVLVGFEAWENIRLSRESAQAAWIGAYKWPVYFFVAVAFWNFVGAGLFGFMINPPISLYYVQGLNLTPVHGHTALFGVYGMLGQGLTLFCLRALRPGLKWRDRPLAIAFWCINGGLALMVLLSMLPVGLLQAWASVEVGTWYARSAEFLQTPMITRLRWMRMFGDTLFAFGAVVLGWFVLGLVTGHSFDRRTAVDEGEYAHRSLETVSGD